MKKRLLPCSLAIIVMIASCKKDNSANNPGIDGTFTLKYLTYKTSGTVTFSSGARTVIMGDYTTTNNQGTIVFNNSILTATGLSYSVDTDFKYYLYDSTGLIDTLNISYSRTLPDTSSVDQFRLIGADSIYFPHGSLIAGEDAITTDTRFGASGGRYSRNGNLLTIIQHYSKDTTYDSLLGNLQAHVATVASIVMEKQ